MGATEEELTQIVVIGGGASGTMVCAHLLNLMDSAGTNKIEIDWIDRSLCGKSFGPGVAYSTERTYHLLNVRAGGMSAFSKHPRHFYEWAKARENSLTEQTFTSREVYGQYLKSLIPQNDARLRKHETEAISIEQSSDGYLIVCENGKRISARYVVLALGILSGSAKFGAQKPWETLSLPIPEDSRVLILGTGLTMVDMALALCRPGTGRTVRAISRRGLLPHLHAAYTPHTPSVDFQTWLAAKNKALRTSLRMIRDECALAQTSGSDWRAVFDLLRAETPQIWKAFSVQDRKAFLRHCVRYWDIHRHRMAPEVYDQIQDFQARKILSVQPGIILGLEKERETWRLLLNSQANGKTEWQFDFLVDCTGFGRNILETQSKLFHCLIRKKFLLISDPPIGAHPNPEFENLYTIGPLRRGSEWESNAIPEIRRQAEELAEDIRRKIRHTAARSRIVSASVRI